MIQRQDIQEAIFKYIAEQMKCSVEELHSDETVFIMDETIAKRYVKILSVGDANIVTVSVSAYSDVVSCLHEKSRDELYESDFVFGQTLHYVPSITQITMLPYTDDFTFELLMGDEIVALAGASFVDDALREVGIDVKKEYRGKKLASLLVHNLTVAILKQNKIPFYLTMIPFGRTTTFSLYGWSVVNSNWNK